MITLYKGTKTNDRLLYTKDSFFDNPFKIIKEDDRILFQYAPITYEGKTYKLHHDKNKREYKNTILLNIPVGKYEFSDESDEDTKIIYYKQ